VLTNKNVIVTGSSNNYPYPLTSAVQREKLDHRYIATSAYQRNSISGQKWNQNQLGHLSQCLMTKHIVWQKTSR